MDTEWLDQSGISTLRGCLALLAATVLVALVYAEILSYFEILWIEQTGNQIVTGNRVERFLLMMNVGFIVCLVFYLGRANESDIYQLSNSSHEFVLDPQELHFSRRVIGIYHIHSGLCDHYGYYHFIIPKDL